MKKFVIIVGVLVVAFAGFAAVASMTQPDEFKVERSTVINAAPAVIFAEVNNLKQWEAWSPWVKKDPAASIAYSGPAAGVDSSMTWDGNHEVGKGTMTIEESDAPSRIKMRLDFEKPMKSTSYSDVTFALQDGATLVTWSMYGPNNLIGKMIGMVIDCEEMVGDAYEEGLASLKAVAEAK